MNEESIIRNIYTAIQLDEDELTWFTAILESKAFKRKDFLLRSGDVCHHQTYVVKGCLKIFYIDNTGIEHILKFAIEDWWAYYLQSFTTQTPAFYSIQVIQDADVFQINMTNHNLLHERILKFEKFSRIMVQNAYVLLQNRMAQNLSATAEEKYNHFKEKYPGLELRIPQKEIATYLGITPEFLSMLRKRRMDRSIS
jgi:CRP-like cAMP-binding protein